TFVPDNDFNGWAYFIYSICDPIGACARDTVYITVAPTNDAPLAIPDTFELFENELLSYFNTLLNDSDIDGDNFYMNAVNGSDVREFLTDYGTVSWNTDGSVEFSMPQSIDSLKAGQSVSVQIEYRIIDDSLATENSYFVILIKGFNNPPVAVDDVFEASEGFNSIASSTLPYQNVLFNDYDIEGDPISVQLVNNSTLNSIVTRYGTFNWETTGEWVFVENQTVVDSLKQGEVVSVVLPYFITDTYVLSEQPANITFNISGVNDAPVAVNDTLVIFEDAGEVIISTNQPEALLSNDSDIDGDDINIERIDFNFNGMLSSDVGTLQWNSDGSYVYTPKRDTVIKLADGEIIYDIFEYTITDNFNGRASAKLVVVIQGINDAPLAVDDSITIFEDTHITFVEEQFGLLSNDGDIDRDPIIVAVNDQNNFSSNGRYGRLTWQPNGAFEYETFIEIVDSLYQGQEVIDEFTYTIVDPLGLTDRASLFITIIGQNDAPVANDFSIATREKAPLLTISARSEGILSNDTDIDDGTEFGIVDIENDQSGNVDGKYGSLQWNYDGTFVYNLNEAMDSLMLNEVVVDSFSYTIQDRFDSLAFAWFIIEITGDNDAPIALSDTLQLSEDDITLLPNWSLLDNDYDTDGDSLFMTAMNGNPISPVSTRFAMFDWTAQGNFTYKRYEYGNKRIELDTLAWDDLIIDSIAYNIADTNGVQSMAFLYLEIEGVNDAPFTKSDANYINENSTSISSSSNSHILSNDFDVDRGDSVMLMNIEGDITGLV
ncbi:MAG TPA: Ig-like domain-containing protein, partial [Prolixibacteraceae bacterium]|nr:Ig-like domain-containing protein [Prolixibacteraceae bacterium]